MRTQEVGDPCNTGLLKEQLAPLKLLFSSGPVNTNTANSGRGPLFKAITTSGTARRAQASRYLGQLEQSSGSLSWPGKYAEAKRLYEPALSICEQRWGPEHPNTLIVQENYASLLQETGQDGKAASLETNQQRP